MKDKELEKMLDEKFIVINKKRFDEASRTCTGEKDDTSVVKFLEALDDLKKDYSARMGKEMNQKYIVCNQDEPYAEKVAQVILEGERAKIKIYIGGPIDDGPDPIREIVNNSDYKKPFLDLESTLSKLGFNVINPIKLVPNPKTYREALSNDIIGLLDADYLFLMPGWEDSKGCLLERTIAEVLGVPIIYDIKSLIGEEDHRPILSERKEFRSLPFKH